jgi:hypothetical protein
MTKESLFVNLLLISSPIALWLCFVFSIGLLHGHTVHDMCRDLIEIIWHDMYTVATFDYQNTLKEFLKAFVKSLPIIYHVLETLVVMFICFPFDMYYGDYSTLYSIKHSVLVLYDISSAFAKIFQQVPISV